MIKKIVITVQGGVVTSVYSDDEDVEITVIDFDNEGSDDDLKKATENMKEVY